jgi:hypothetical protein
MVKLLYKNRIVKLNLLNNLSFKQEGIKENFITEFQ